LSDNVTTVAPTAALFKVAVQFVLWLLFSEPATQVMLESTGSVVRVMLAVRVPPLRLDVIVVVSSAEKLPTVAWNVALDEPLLTVTLAGTVTRALLLDKPTVVFAVAFAVRVTVQVEDPAALKEFALQLRELSAAATILIWAVWFTPFRVPVIVAVSLVVTGEIAVTVNCALVAAFGIVTLAGVVN
jgi:hypothetical protein